MGYYISKLKSIPSHFNWYLFLVGDYQKYSLINNFFKENFLAIASNLDENTALIGYNTRLENDLQNVLKENKNRKFAKALRFLEKKRPGLLIINAHPLEIQKDTTIIYAPFKNLEKIYSSTDSLIKDLISFSKGENTNFISNISKHKFIHKKLSASIGLSLGIIAININIE